MAWLEKIQNKSKEEKVRLIWICVLVGAVLLILLWLLTWGYKKSAPIDTTLFETISTSFEKAKTNFKPVNK